MINYNVLMYHNILINVRYFFGALVVQRIWWRQTILRSSCFNYVINRERMGIIKKEAYQRK